ncbi:NAD(P)H-dependent oxidoreductase [Burkholderia sp. IDO3]|uniref:NAD(P)H-dependent oxidoreductase n=1 Tax=Burkholderia sp. IDO3 TaxID=1705310 RepID=UPI001F0770EC|nr:NAD(P)H-dependent oxidoreductase [Burkholderia sp. IDO3]
MYRSKHIPATAAARSPHPLHHRGSSQMNTLIVHCHPEARSFNAALRDTAAQAMRTLGHEIDVSDLYAEAFDPVEAPRHYRCRANDDVFSALAEQRHASAHDTLPEDVRREIGRLEQADLVIFQFPIWWHAAPAMLKGWFDRVFVNGGLYTGSRRYDHGHFRGRRAICSVTTGAPAATFAPDGRSGDIDLLLWPIHYSLYYMGYDVLKPVLAHGVQDTRGGYAYQADAPFIAELATHRENLARRLANWQTDTPLRFPGWDDWDEHGVLKPGVTG